MFGILIKKYVIIIMFIIVAVMSENKYINFTCFVFDVNILFSVVLISSRLGKALSCAGYTTSRPHVELLLQQAIWYYSNYYSVLSWWTYLAISC